MKQAAKATALVLAVSLLSGCSSSPKPADKPQAKTRCEIAVEKVTEKAGLLRELQSAKKDYNNRALLSWLYYIVEESDCFDSEIVSEAKAGIAVILKQ
jgi:outer membrane murein-binding lipoprotein Lpp